MSNVFSVGEHLLRKCETCGYAWAEACRTTKQAPKEDN
jgi:hypothetical protein